MLSMVLGEGLVVHERQAARKVCSSSLSTEVCWILNLREMDFISWRGFVTTYRGAPPLRCLCLCMNVQVWSAFCRTVSTGAGPVD